MINRKAPDGDYITSWDGFEFLPGALQGLALLGRSPIRIVVVTNQRGIARGRMTEGDLEEIHRRMLAAVGAAGGRIDAVYHCPHEGGCRCRKPETGMFEDAAIELGLELTETAVVGDSSSDMLAAERIGAVRVTVGGGQDVEIDRRVADLLAAARWLVAA